MRGLLICVLGVSALLAGRPAAQAAPPATTGPMIGHVDERTAHIWLRPAGEAEVTLTVRDPAGKTVFEEKKAATAERDFCIAWAVVDLEPATGYAYSFTWQSGGDASPPAGPWPFRTAPPADLPGRAALAFGSCASEKFPAIWERMAVEGAELVFLCGDTPYIDTSDLAKNRQRHREFLAQPGLAELVRTRPTLGTWDDHDFGGNDSDGGKVDRETIRKVFTEYRAHATFGAAGEGIYTRLRHGPVEVFLIDARYFSQTGPSPADPAKKTLLGPRQWEWLREALAASTAPFKILATGMVWHDKPNKEKDDWQTYAHEREALFGFLEEKKISGVVLLGGDVHVSLLLEHLPAKRLGYPLFEYVVSPLHDKVIPSLVPTTDKRLRWSAAEPNVFLRTVADTTGPVPTLTSTWIQMDGTRLHEHVITLPPRAK
ncbi:MAG: alkaline phosphatase family protein [Planctomycetes bacterium]|nr:alkaline phosphatase family protein [Planctomycetota bacterium]